MAGHYYKVIWDDKFLTNEGFIGLACHNKLAIYLCRIFRGEKLAKSIIEENVLHEIIHAVDVNYNNHSLNEDTVSKLAEGLYQVLRDNFKF